MRQNHKIKRDGDQAAFRGELAYASKVRKLIKRKLKQGEPTIELLSAVSGNSQRTIQRRLAAEGTSFSLLLDNVRREQALKELKDTSKQMSLIAAELGYSGRPAFVRAVRRWFGLSPGQLRRHNP